MVVSNYSDFLILKEMKHWEFLSKNLSESDNWTDLKSRIFDYLYKAADKGDVYLEKIAKQVFNYFKTNPKVLILVVALLIAKFGYSKKDVSDFVPDNSLISAEEIYSKAQMEAGFPEDAYDEESESEEEDEVSQPKKQIKFSSVTSGGFGKFLHAIAGKESSHDPEKINELGYMGKYQFGEIALKDILKQKPGESDDEYQERIKSFWPKNFGKVKTKSDFNFFKSRFTNRGISFWPEHKQDQAMKQLLKNNKEYLGDYIDKWVGKTKKGIKITKSGLLAGAHLLGPSNVKKFLDEGLITKDANGTPITEYIKKFGGYSVNI